MSKIMKVGELIEILKQFPQDENVVIKGSRKLIYNIKNVSEQLVDPFAPNVKSIQAVLITTEKEAGTVHLQNKYSDHLQGIDDTRFMYGGKCCDDEW